MFNTNPHGTGTQGAASDIIALGESWAYHMGHFLSDRKYTNSSSNQFEQGFTYRNGDIRSGSTVVATTGLNAHINLLEDFSRDRTNDPDNWIPQGLYYDLIDNRNDVTASPFRVGINDQVVNYTNQSFFNALDVTLGYNMRGSDVTAKSDEMGEVVFHELTHAAHYNKVGNACYNDFVDAVTHQMIFSRNPPYGRGDAGTRSEIIALGESWAYHMGHFLSDRKYGLNSSQTGNGQFTYNNQAPLTGLSSHINALEDFNPNNANDLDRWIPQGLFYDLIDNRNEDVPIIDRVSGYNNQQFFNALDSDIKTLGSFEIRLLNENSNNQSVNVTNLFNQYGH